MSIVIILKTKDQLRPIMMQNRNKPSLTADTHVQWKWQGQKKSTEYNRSNAII